MSLKDLYLQGMNALRNKHEAESLEQGKRLRAGNSGCLLPDGTVIGECPRRAFLRLDAEADVQKSFSTRLMFEAGTANEWLWKANLEAAGQVLKCEEEIPTSWKTTNGVEVTGRPDIVIMSGAVPACVLELKQLSATWSTRNKLVRQEISTAHVCQLAHYMWQLGCAAGKLCYTSRAAFAIYGKGLPKPSEPGSEYFEYNDSGMVKNLRPGMMIHDFSISPEGVVCVGPEGGEQRPTLVTVEGIKNFYEAVSTMESENDVGPRISLQTHEHGVKQEYSTCDYCEMRPVCDSCEQWGLRSWLEGVKKLASDSGKTGGVR